MKFIVSLFFITLFFSSCAICKRSQKASNNSASCTIENFTEIAFGSGGGFTGSVEGYRVLKNGRLMQGEKMIKTISKSQLKDLLTALESANINSIKINDPGNLYYFIALKNSSSEHRVVWNDLTKDASALKSVYETLLLFTK